MTPTAVIGLGDNKKILQANPPPPVDLVYIDPPFNTGKVQKGYVGKYDDNMGDKYVPWLRERVVVGRECLRSTGSFFIHVDYREAHYVKVMCDEVFGRDCFMNEIIWAYDYGGRAKSRWSAKHDNIFWYVRDVAEYTYNFDAIDRVPYMAPGLVGPEKAAKGKTPTDVWWNTIVPTQGKERVGYPTQKPLAILRRIISVHTNPGDKVLDYFAGSGTSGVAALELGRSAYLIDESPAAYKTMTGRFSSLQLPWVPWSTTTLC